MAGMDVAMIMDEKNFKITTLQDLGRVKRMIMGKRQIGVYDYGR